MVIEETQNTVLADKAEQFLEAQEGFVPPVLPLNEFKLPYILEGFNYPVSSWPILLAPELTNNLAAISTSLSRLLQKVPNLYFKDDIEEIADFYFNGDQDRAQFAMLCLEKDLEVSNRCDLIYTDEGFKVMEVNMGSSIGGMEVQNFAEYIKKMHPLLNKSNTADKYMCRPTQSIYIEFILQQIFKLFGEDLLEVNIYLVSETLPEEIKRASKFYNHLLEEVLHATGKKSNVFLGSIAELRFTGDALTYDNDNVHAVLIFDFSLVNITPDLFRAFIMDKVYFPDNLATMFLKDKRNLALLQALATDGKLEENDRRLVLTNIPWTVIVEEKQVDYEGEKHDLQLLLFNRKDEFVIKVADGLQGKDVHVGKFIDQDSWQKLLVKAFVSKKYIAQQYCKSESLKAPNLNNLWVPHTLVWGAFGFGNTYGGAWVRMSEASKDSGVINSATGATEGVVFECI
jgi:hypothetical protein